MSAASLRRRQKRRCGMIQMLMISDDFTGALDTGVQLAATGAATRVITDPDVDLHTVDTGCEVLVIDAETRHLQPEDAYKIVYRITEQAIQYGVPHIYKKTDSALRGNIGAELSALLDASGEKQLPFLPSFPQIGRSTKGGIHFIDGIPVADSVFGADPFEPVRHSEVETLLAEQSGLPAQSCGSLESGSPLPDKDGIQIYDSETLEELTSTGKRLIEADRLKVMAGCAGFASTLPGLLNLKSGLGTKRPLLNPRLLVICGSVNPITLAQLDNAEQAGFVRLRMTPQQKLERLYWESPEGEAAFDEILKTVESSPCCILDTNDSTGNVLTAEYAQAHGMNLDDIRVNAAQSIGYLAGRLCDTPAAGTLLITGGDTLLQCMESMGVHEIEPLYELKPGVVISRIRHSGQTRYILSKSGGFGGPELLTEIAEQNAINFYNRKTQTITTEEDKMEFAKLPGLTPDGRIYQNADMGTLEALLPTGGYKTAHAPALLELPNGDMLCAWFAGTYEGSADIRIICSRLPEGTDTWLPPVDISRDPNRSEQNPSLFYGPDNAVWAIYTAQLDRQAGKDNMQFTSVIRCQKSTDGGKTWGDYETLFPREGSFCRQPIQILKNGRWLFGNWICTDAVDGLSGDPSVFQISDDEGTTWRQVDVPNSRGRVHVTAVELDNGHLVAFMRSREADNIYRSESFDWGDSWSEPAPTPLPNNNSSISAIKLQSGRIAVAYNPTCTPDPKPGVAAWPGLRCPVAVALSEDGGLTFPIIRWMERGEGFMGEENRTNNRQYEYPSLTQSRDGQIHLAYAANTREGVKYVRFTEQDVMGSKREKVGLYNPTAAQSR